MKERLDIRYGPYRLVAASYRGSFQAVAFLGRQETLRVGGESLVEAMADLQVKLQADRAALFAARGDGEPSAEEYAVAIEGQRWELSSLGYAMLLRHARIPDRKTSIEELARACRAEPDHGHKSYVQLARTLGDALAFRPREKALPRDRALLSICTLEKPASGQASIWTLREGVSRALTENFQIQ
ncbi:MAG: hypothetical protein Devi2KO_07070 [Devosia indica]